MIGYGILFLPLVINESFVVYVLPSRDLTPPLIVSEMSLKLSQKSRSGAKLNQSDVAAESIKSIVSISRDETTEWIALCLRTKRTLLTISELLQGR